MDQWIDRQNETRQQTMGEDMPDVDPDANHGESCKTH